MATTVTTRYTLSNGYIVEIFENSSFETAFGTLVEPTSKKEVEYSSEYLKGSRQQRNVRLIAESLIQDYAREGQQVDANNWSSKPSIVTTDVYSADKKGYVTFEEEETTDSEPTEEEAVEEEEAAEQEQNLGEIPPEATVNPNINQSVPPVSGKFTVSGRAYDIETGKFLERAKISVGLGDKALGLRSTRTDNQGKFKFKIKLQIDEETGQSYFTNYNLRYQKKGYSLERQPIIAADGTVLATLNNVGLKTKQTRLEQEKSQLQQNIQEEVQNIKDQIPKDPGKFLKDRVVREYKKVKDNIIPIVLTLLATYGISRLRDFLNGDRSEVDCPAQTKINETVKKKNKLVRQLNNIYKTIDSATKAVNTTVRTINIFRALANVLINIPIPTTIGLPPGPAGGVIFSVPASTINKIQEAIKKFDRLLAKFSGFSLPVLVALAMLQSILALAIKLLNLLDGLIATCAGNIEGGEQLSTDLLEATKEAENDGEGSLTEVNGFLLEVITDPNGKVGTIQRRQAIAKNKDGVTLLKGDSSFSSSDQILLNELAFYIQVNDLKA